MHIRLLTKPIPWRGDDLFTQQYPAHHGQEEYPLKLDDISTAELPILSVAEIAPFLSSPFVPFSRTSSRSSFISRSLNYLLALSPATLLGRLTCHQGCESDRHGLGGRNHVHVYHLYEVSSHRGHRLVVEMVCDHADGETDDHHLEHRHGLDRSQSATMQMEEYGPTSCQSACGIILNKMKTHIPRSSVDHLYQYVCCAFRGRHHRHRDGSHTQRMRIYFQCQRH